MKAPGGAPNWRRASKADAPELSAFLEAREERCLGFVDRLLAEGSLRLPNPLKGAVLFHRGPSGGLDAAVLLHPAMLVFPVFEEAPSEAALDVLGREMARRGFGLPASLIGEAEAVELLESRTAAPPDCGIRYYLMSRRVGAPVQGGGRASLPGLSSRLAVLSDLDALLPLQEAYEREEVLTGIHEFNLAACEASLRLSLSREDIVVAEIGGRIVGKAAINARGFRFAQIGGVFVPEGMRGRGIGRALVSFLLSRLDAAGLSAALFVKTDNRPARRLYEGLGFERIGPFKVDYYKR